MFLKSTYSVQSPLLTGLTFWPPVCLRHTCVLAVLGLGQGGAVQGRGKV